MASDPNPTTVIHAIKGMKIAFDYLNYRGRQDHRTVEIGHVWWGSTEWHPTPGWLLAAFDLGKREWRDFAMKDMANVRFMADVEPLK